VSGAGCLLWAEWQDEEPAGDMLSIDACIPEIPNRNQRALSATVQQLPVLFNYVPVNTIKGNVLVDTCKGNTTTMSVTAHVIPAIAFPDCQQVHSPGILPYPTNTQLILSNLHVPCLQQCMPPMPHSRAGQPAVGEDGTTTGGVCADSDGALLYHHQLQAIGTLGLSVSSSTTTKRCTLQSTQRAIEILSRYHCDS
jgi:hypothetical protein